MVLRLKQRRKMALKFSQWNSLKNIIREKWFDLSTCLSYKLKLSWNPQCWVWISNNVLIIKESLVRLDLPLNFISNAQCLQSNNSQASFLCCSIQNIITVQEKLNTSQRNAFIDWKIWPCAPYRLNHYNCSRERKKIKRIAAKKKYIMKKNR